MTAINPVTDFTVEREVGVITVDFPPVNALGHMVRFGIGIALERAFADPAVNSVVLRCAGRTFFAGADITEFGGPMAPPVLRDIAIQIENGNKPVIAAIHGTALGGGLETALACHWRIATREARFGLPEVKLGLLAGAGGTQRLPRLVGAGKALDMVVGGEPIDAADALRHGLIDVIIDGDLRTEAIAFATGIAGRADALRRVRDLPPPIADTALFARFRAKRAEQLRGFEAPEASIRCIESAITEPFDDGMKTERRLFEHLMQGEQCAAQRYVFFAERAATKLPGLAGALGGFSIDMIFLAKGSAPAKSLMDLLHAAGIAIEREGPAMPSTEALIAIRSPVADGQAVVRVPVSFGPSLAAPRLLEIVRRPDLAEGMLAALFAFGKRLGLACVVTLAGDRPIGGLMHERLVLERDRCLADGMTPSTLATAADSFGLSLDLDDAGMGDVVRDDDVLDRIILPLANAGARLIESGAAARASDIDVACVKLDLWKVYRGGPMFHADQVGLACVVRRLRDFERRSGSDYRPSPLLERLAAEGRTLHRYQGGNHG